jgi:membrane protease YdiL (CAAX protease family)
MSRVSGPFSLPSVSLILIQLFGISLPEEVYFRGFLQERLGNAMSGLVIVSALFSLMHVPQFIFYGDIYPILTFFPSLVMGFLYMKTSNIVPSTIFHFSANILWLGFSVT